MKKTIILFLLVLFAQVTKAQESNLQRDPDAVYSSVGIEKAPEFPGGMKAFEEYIEKNFKYPDVKSLIGRVIVQFVIEKDGSLTDIRVLRDVGYGTGKEAIRVLKNCPKWSPGVHNGQILRIRYSLPINIELR
ncbi:energy transducer TonB [Flavobacterium sp.]|uniref:energy transducer TonB n=1 Tax=Flavobacterium sp. TaxID=239 RepID=UPI003D6BC967